MGDDCRRSSVITRQRGGPHEGSLRAEFLCKARDLSVVGGNNDPLEESTRTRAFDRMGHHRLAGERPNVLPRYALTTTARGYHRDLHKTSLSAATTLSCSCSVSPGKSGKVMASAA